MNATANRDPAPVTIPSMLKYELEIRCQRNPKYSLRAFARDLEISPQRLSHVINARHGLSPDAATLIAKRLNWSNAEQTVFRDLAESHHARSSIRRNLAQERLKTSTSQYQSLDIDSFRVVSDWYHFAILELTQVADFQSDPVWIADTLGITVHEATSAIDRLLRLEALEVHAGRLRATQDFLVNAAGVPSEAVRKFHRQIMERASHALTFQTVAQREFSGLILTVSDGDVPAAKKMIQKFRDDFNAAFSKPLRDSKVYALGVQFFGLQKPNSNSPSRKKKKVKA